MTQNLIINVLVSSNSHHHPLFSFFKPHTYQTKIWQQSSMTTLSILGRVCIKVLGLYVLEALGVLMGSLEFFLFKLKLSYCAHACLGFLDTIGELHTMDDKMFNKVFYWKVKVSFICNEGLSNPSLIFSICIGGIYHTNLRSLV